MCHDFTHHFVGFMIAYLCWTMLVAVESAWWTGRESSLTKFWWCFLRRSILKQDIFVVPKERNCTFICINIV